MHLACRGAPPKRTWLVVGAGQGVLGVDPERFGGSVQGVLGSVQGVLGVGPGP